MVDLRSDTVTKPTPGMLDAMMQAELGDDVFGEDPTVNAFQKKIAEMFGMESGLFVPSGVMSNQLAIKTMTNVSEEIIIEETGHVFNYETSAASLISSVQLRPLKGERGKLTPDLVRSGIRMGKDWEPKPALVVIENTTNKGGGACYTKQELKDIFLVSRELDLGVHLDGARIWNAITATGIDPLFFSTIADTMTVSFSKGLGAPVGSMLLSTGENIERARRYRKMLGGGMRQIGLLAAAADYGVEHHWPLLEEDHRRAKDLARFIETCSSLSIDPDTVESNIVIFDIAGVNAQAAVDQLEEKGVRMVPFGPATLRATFHYQISDKDLQIVKKALGTLFN